MPRTRPPPHCLNHMTVRPVRTRGTQHTQFEGRSQHTPPSRSQYQFHETLTLGRLPTADCRRRPRPVFTRRDDVNTTSRIWRNVATHVDTTKEQDCSRFDRNRQSSRQLPGSTCVTAAGRIPLLGLPPTNTTSSNALPSTPMISPPRRPHKPRVTHPCPASPRVDLTAGIWVAWCNQNRQHKPSASVPSRVRGRPQSKPDHRASRHQPSQPQRIQNLEIRQRVVSQTSRLSLKGRVHPHFKPMVESDTLTRP